MTVRNPQARRRPRTARVALLSAAAGAAAVALVDRAGAAVITDNNTGGNFSTLFPGLSANDPSTILQFTLTGTNPSYTAVNDVGSPLVLNQFQFTNTTGGTLTVTGATSGAGVAGFQLVNNGTVGAQILLSGTGTTGILAPLDLAGNTLVGGTGSGNLTIAGPVTTSNGPITLTFGSATNGINVLFGGNIVGTTGIGASSNLASFNLAGSTVVINTGANVRDYGSNDGTVSAMQGANVMLNGGGTLSLRSDATGAVNFGNTVTLGNAGTETINLGNGAGTGNYTGVLGGLNFGSNGQTLAVTGNRALQFTNGVSLTGATDTIANNLNAGNVTFASGISGTSLLAFSGTATTVLNNATGANAYTGGTLISAGTLNANSAGAIGTGTVRVTTGTINLNAQQNNTITETGGSSGVGYNVNNANGGNVINVTNTATLFFGTAVTSVGNDTFNVSGGTNAGVIGFTGANNNQIALTRGGNFNIGSGAVIVESVKGAAPGSTGGFIGAGTAFGTAADLYFGPRSGATLTGEQVTVGAGTAFNGLSSDHSTGTFASGTVSANSNFTIQLLNNANLVLGGTGAANALNIVQGPLATGRVDVTVVNNSGGTGATLQFAGSAGNASPNVANLSGINNIIVGDGINPVIFQSNASQSFGSIAGQTPNGVIVNNKGTVDPGNTSNPLASASGANLTLNFLAGSRLLLNDPNQLNGDATINLQPGSIVDLQSTNGATMLTGSQPLNAGAGVIARLLATNVANLQGAGNFAPSAIYEITGGTAQANLTSLEAATAAGPVNGPVLSGILTNDGSSRTFGSTNTTITVGPNGAGFAASTGTIFAINDNVVAGGNNVTFGVGTNTIDGLTKNGSLQFLGTFSGTNTTFATSGSVQFFAPASVTGDLNLAPPTVLGVASNTAFVVTGNVNVLAGSGTTGVVALGPGATLDFSGNAPTLNVTDNAAAVDAVISTSIVNATGLTKTGDGTIQLSGSNTITGPIRVNDGTLLVANNLALNGASSGPITVSLNPGSSGTGSNGARLEIGAGAGAINLSNLQPITAGNALRFSTDVFGGSTSANVATIPSNVIQGGTLEVNANVGNATNSAMTTLTLTDGSTVRFTAANVKYGNTTTSTPAFTGVPGSNGIFFDVPINNGTNAAVLNGVINGGVELVKVGQGTLDLARGGNTLSGIDVRQGVLGLGDQSVGALVNGTTFAPVIVEAGAVLDTGRNSGTPAILQGLTGSGTVTGSLVLGGGNIGLLTVNNTTNDVFTGTIVDGLRPLYVAKDGRGSLRLSNPASNYSGTTSVNGGTLLVAGDVSGTPGVTGPLGAPTNAVNLVVKLGSSSGTIATALLMDTPNTFGRPIAVVGNSNAAAVPTLGASTNVAGIATFSGTVSLGKSAVLTAANGATAAFSGGFSGTGGLTINAPASFVSLTGTHTYSGTTAVNAGTLIANGTLSGAGPISVAALATLSGNGSIVAPVTLTGSSNLSPGNTPAADDVGLLTLGNGATLNGANLVADLHASPGVTGAGGGTNYDEVVSGGAVTLTGSTTLDLRTSAAYTPAASDTFYLVDVTPGGPAVSGAFSAVNVNGASVALTDNGNGTFNFTDPSGQTVYQLAYNQAGDPLASGSDVVLSVVSTSGVPEPTTLGVLGLSAAGLLARRRKKAWR